MEIFIGVAVIAGFIYFLFSFERPNTNGDPSETILRDQSSPKRNLSGQTGMASHPAFDEGSSKHLPERRILTGAAYVVDGDTVKISNTQVRLFGIDAPELNHPYGKKAKWALHALCKGQVVRAEITDEDAYGRTVAQCFLADGRDLSAEMVKQGLAIDWPKFSGGRYRNLEAADARKKMFLADARQKGRMHVWEKFESKQAKQ